MEPSEVMELFVQDNVKLHQSSSNFIQYINAFGTFFVTEYLNSNKARFIEWKPNDVTVEADTQDQEWTVVKSTGRRNRTVSSSEGTAENARARFIKLAMVDIKSFKVSHSKQRLLFQDGLGDVIHAFQFPSSDCGRLLVELRNLMHTIVSKRDKQLYYVQEADDTICGGSGGGDERTAALVKSFKDVRLHGVSPTSLWSTMQDFRKDPLTATMQTFAKVGDIVYRSAESGLTYNDYQHVNELQRSLTELDESTTAIATTSHTQGEYEMIQHVLKLPERKDYPRGNALTNIQWMSLQDHEGRIEDVESVKLVIFRGGISPDLRPIVWKYLLLHYPWDSSRTQQLAIDTERRAEYSIMKAQWQALSKGQEERFADYRERKSLVEKDVNRTDRAMDFYSGDGNSNLKILYDVLMTYVMYNFDLGYVQGMSDLLSPLLYLLRDEVDTFWCFVGFMNKVCSNFDIDQAGMKEQLSQLHTLLAFIDPELSAYLDRHESGNMFFCFRWMLVWFKRELRHDDILSLWEVLWTELPCTNFHLLVCVALLCKEKRVLIEGGYGFTEILKHINELSGNIDLPTILNRAEGIYHQIKEAAHLSNQVRLILGLPLVGNETSQTSESNNSSPNDSNDNSNSVEVINDSERSNNIAHAHANSAHAHSHHVAYNGDMVRIPSAASNGVARNDLDSEELQRDVSVSHGVFTSMNYSTMNDEIVFDRGLEQYT